MNDEATNISSFEVRDREIQWLGTSNKYKNRKTKETLIHEVSTYDHELVHLVTKQSDQIAAQQEKPNPRSNGDVMPASLRSTERGTVPILRLIHLIRQTKLV